MVAIKLKFVGFFLVLFAVSLHVGADQVNVANAVELGASSGVSLDATASDVDQDIASDCIGVLAMNWAIDTEQSAQSLDCNQCLDVCPYGGRDFTGNCECCLPPAEKSPSQTR